ncbi:MAG: hypothetical protein PVH71_10560, partial [Chromatiales bacterium]
KANRKTAICRLIPSPKGYDRWQLLTFWAIRGRAAFALYLPQIRRASTTSQSSAFTAVLDYINRKGYEESDFQKWSPWQGEVSQSES